MHRREALKNVAILLGGALSATTLGVLFDSCNPTQESKMISFSTDQEALIAEIADIIIPTTTSPGAKAAGVGPFISMMVKECYPSEPQQEFIRGLEDVNKRSKAAFNKSFAEITVAQREKVLTDIRDETVKLQKEEKDKKEKEKLANPKPKEKEIPGKVKPKDKSYFFAIIRDLTLLGYFSSEIGATQALAYVAIPGRYDGCVDLKPGQKVWA